MKDFKLFVYGILLLVGLQPILWLEMARNGAHQQHAVQRRVVHTQAMRDYVQAWMEIELSIAKGNPQDLETLRTSQAAYLRVLRGTVAIAAPDDVPEDVKTFLREHP